jgi:hypothetical protein
VLSSCPAFGGATAKAIRHSFKKWRPNLPPRPDAIIAYQAQDWHKQPQEKRERGGGPARMLPEFTIRDESPGWDL